MVANVAQDLGRIRAVARGATVDQVVVAAEVGQPMTTHAHGHESAPPTQSASRVCRA